MLPPTERDDCFKGFSLFCLVGISIAFGIPGMGQFIWMYNFEVHLRSCITKLSR